jgi:beta-lactamase regulating signal transducer with metallopeptidase domain
MFDSGNFLAWMVQAFILVSAGSLLLRLFRVQHPRTELVFCHALLAGCMLLPLLQPWRHPVIEISGTNDDLTAAPPRNPGAPAGPAAAPAAVVAKSMPLPAKPGISWGRIVRWTLLAGVVVKLFWLLGGMWRIRKYRIEAMPLYPIPESVQAAAALTHANAVFCVSTRLTGPATLGWLAPVVLLPQSFLALGDEAQCGIACHELLHIQRRDWLITVIEELAGALLWFNPAIWLLLAQTRLVREQLVDAEVVRLTASREPYIDALLTIARGAPVPDLGMDLAPTPLFLRRRHLTHRMHSLLQEASVSRFRLVSSYASITAVLSFAGWFALGSFPLTGNPRFREAAKLVADTPVERPTPAPPELTIQPVVAETPGSFVPLPPDPHELVTGAVNIAATPADRAAALTLLGRAIENSLSHAPDTPPFRFDAPFTSSAGMGELTETWLSGNRWRYTMDLGSYSLVRIGSNRLRVDGNHVSEIPTRTYMLRNAIFWRYQLPQPAAQIRTAAVEWNGRPVTCLLSSNVAGPAAQIQSRLWEERELCIDNASGLLQIHSIAPGTFTVYGYDRSVQFHGRAIPDRITIFVNGGQVADAQLNIADAGTVDQTLLTPTPEMIANGPVIQTASPARFPMDVPNPLPSKTIQPVIVHAEVDPEGKLLDEEVSAASDPALAQIALDVVKTASLPHAPFTQRQEYINVRFHPAPH